MKNLWTLLFMTILMAIWGFNVPTIKILVTEFPPITITGLRILTAGVVVFIILGFMRKVRKPTSKEALYIFFGGMFSIVGHHYFLSNGLIETTAANGGLILGTGPILTAILSAAVLKTMPSLIQMIGFLLGIAGVIFIVLVGNEGISGLSLGDLYVFLSILSQAFSFILISKAARTIDSRLLTGYMLLSGGAILFLISLWTEPGGIGQLSSAPAYTWWIFLASAVLATAIGQMGYNYAISKIGPAEASVFLNLNTFFALVGSALLLNETITVFHLIGLLLIIPGVLFGSGAVEEMLRRRRRKVN
ncbi:DMT family transporter [Cytobacillus purgationiresistens]|uniref:Drug/metabolite transporter (DMT)-like permease n=1 Tax=Cytobacillus purgationiresistens TaxID=863449 RepID=A0ABU0AQG4_9BACI|nr:DMT family transporter [Cytobacillus purgationiresistens]MDQ0273460.1 drug/metabolite transporter (DMT)-like permease [Cytobacillus purgationiresistens]